MKTLRIFSVILVIFAHTSLCFEVWTTAIYPKGLRACIVAEKGIEKFSVYGYSQEIKMSRVSPQFGGIVSEPNDGLWCYVNDDLKLNIGTHLVYWYFVNVNGSEVQGETKVKRIQAADFVDKSAVQPKVEIEPCLLEDTRPVTPSIKIQEEVNPVLFSEISTSVNENDNPVLSPTPTLNVHDPALFPVEPVTPKTILTYSSLTTNNPPIQAMISNNLKQVHNANDDSVTLENIDKSNFKTKDHSKMIPPSDKITEPRIDTRLNFELNDHNPFILNLLVNCTPCQNGPNQIPETSTRTIIDTGTNPKNGELKNCKESLKNESNRNYLISGLYNELFTKFNSLQDELKTTKVKFNKQNAILKEALKIILAYKSNTTNKLILNSSEKITDYKQTLRSVIKNLLAIETNKYTILDSVLYDDKTIIFELKNFEQKLRIYLEGRIELIGSKFQVLDFDLNDT